MKSRKDSHLTEKTKVLPTRTSQSPDLSPSSLIISLSTLPCVLIQLHRGFITLSWGQRGNSACSRIYTQKNTSRFKLFVTVHPNLNTLKLHPSPLSSDWSASGSLLRGVSILFVLCAFIRRAFSLLWERQTQASSITEVLQVDVWSQVRITSQ